MKARAFVSTLLFCLLAASVSLAADGFMGTWKLNEAQSKISPGMAKNSTVIYEAAGESIKVTIDGVDADGNSTHNEWTGKYDGADYAVTGDPASDSRAVTKVDDHTLAFNVKKAGKVTMTGRIVLSEDGKTRTVTTTGTDSKGAQVSGTAVYDKE
ncbi:MAG: hypothetical protein WCE61_08725 [Candidatus Acidiferrum sp.]